MSSATPRARRLSTSTRTISRQTPLSISASVVAAPTAPTPTPATFIGDLPASQSLVADVPAERPDDVRGSLGILSWTSACELVGELPERISRISLKVGNGVHDVGGDVDGDARPDREADLGDPFLGAPPDGRSRRSGWRSPGRRG